MSFVKNARARFRLFANERHTASDGDIAMTLSKLLAVLPPAGHVPACMQ
jgi:hypothetical protein